MKPSAASELVELVTTISARDAATGTWSIHAVGGPRDAAGREPVLEAFRGVDGHPYEHLVGWYAPDSAHTLVLSASAAGVAVGATPQLPQPGAPRLHTRLVVVVDRSGTSRYFEVGSDGPAVESDAYADGLLADGLRCALRAPVPPPRFPLGALLGRMWLASVARLADNGIALDPDAIHALDPLNAALATKAHLAGWSTDRIAAAVRSNRRAPGTDWASDEVLAAAESLSWDEAAGCIADGMPDDVAAWAGAHLRAKLAMSSLPPGPLLIAHIARKNRPAAERLAGQLEVRGWLEPLP